MYKKIQVVTMLSIILQKRCQKIKKLLVHQYQLSGQNITQQHIHGIDWVTVQKAIPNALGSALIII